MFVRKVNGSLGTRSLAALERFARRLDGKAVTELLLSDENETAWLILAGGAGRHLVEFRKGGTSRTLKNPRPKVDVFHSFVAAGQRIECSDEDVVGVTLALRAVRHFADTGEPDPTLLWS
jgi:hypothetical protein